MFCTAKLTYSEAARWRACMPRWVAIVLDGEAMVMLHLRTWGVEERDWEKNFEHASARILCHPTAKPARHCHPLRCPGNRLCRTSIGLFCHLAVPIIARLTACVL